MILHQETTLKANGGYLGHLSTTPSLKPCTYYSVYLGLHLVSMPVHGDQFCLGGIGGGSRHWVRSDVAGSSLLWPLRCMNHLRALFPSSSDEQSSLSGIYVVCDTSNRKPREGYNVNRGSSGSSVSPNGDRRQRMSKISWVSVIRFVF